MHKLATILTATVLALGCDGASAAVFYVGPDGDDAWSGRLQCSQPRPHRWPADFAARARDAVRRLKAQSPLREPVRVVVADGHYAMQGTLTFTPDDSGTENCPIVYEAAPGAGPSSAAGGS